MVVHALTKLENMHRHDQPGYFSLAEFRYFLQPNLQEVGVDVRHIVATHLRATNEIGADGLR